MRPLLLNFLRAALFLALIPLTAFPADKPVIKIGVVAGITGDHEMWGEPFKNSLLLAQKEHPATKFDYQLVIEDCHSTIPGAISAAKKLVSIDHVDAMLSLFVEMGQVVAPIAEQAGIVHIATATDPVIAKGKHGFLLYTMSDAVAQQMTQGLLKRNLHKVSIFTMRNPYCVNIYEQVIPALRAAHIDVVTDLKFNPEERDFRTLIVKAKAATPDICLLITFSPTLELLARQLKDAGVTHYTAGEDMENATDMSLFEGQWFVSSPAPGNAFTNKYQAQYHSKPAIASANGYDALNLLIAAYEKLGANGQKPTPDQVAAELTMTNSYFGALGTLYGKPDRIFRVPAVEKIIRNGVPVLTSNDVHRTPWSPKKTK